MNLFPVKMPKGLPKGAQDRVLFAGYIAVPLCLIALFLCVCPGPHTFAQALQIVGARAVLNHNQPLPVWQGLTLSDFPLVPLWIGGHLNHWFSHILAPIPHNTLPTFWPLFRLLCLVLLAFKLSPCPLLGQGAQPHLFWATLLNPVSVYALFAGTWGIFWGLTLVPSWFFFKKNSEKNLYIYCYFMLLIWGALPTLVPLLAQVILQGVWACARALLYHTDRAHSVHSLGYRRAYGLKLSALKPWVRSMGLAAGAVLLAYASLCLVALGVRQNHPAVFRYLLDFTMQQSLGLGTWVTTDSQKSGLLVALFVFLLFMNPIKMFHRAPATLIKMLSEGARSLVSNSTPALQKLEQIKQNTHAWAWLASTAILGVWFQKKHPDFLWIGLPAVHQVLITLRGPCIPKECGARPAHGFVGLLLVAACGLAVWSQREQVYPIVHFLREQPKEQEIRTLGLINPTWDVFHFNTKHFAWLDETAFQAVGSTYTVILPIKEAYLCEKHHFTVYKKWTHYAACAKNTDRPNEPLKSE